LARNDLSGFQCAQDHGAVVLLERGDKLHQPVALALEMRIGFAAEEAPADSEVPSLYRDALI
jgi:hypothetical protein